MTTLICCKLYLYYSLKFRRRITYTQWLSNTVGIPSRRDNLVKKDGSREQDFQN
uniref:Uncharacterized protein n=1 Tax=Arundo donax TaxID=35708 RepID=A0A0A9GWM3_ARUDO